MRKDICIIENCNKPIYVKKHKLCNGHYMQLIRKGKPKHGKLRKYKKLDWQYERNSNT